VELHERLRPGHQELLDVRADGFGTTAAAMATAGSPWRDGHIPHALPLDPLTLLDANGLLLAGAEIRERLARVGPRPNTFVDLWSPFTLYGDGRGHLVHLAYVALRLAGVDSVSCLIDGWPAWREDPDRPVTRIVTAPQVRARYADEPGNAATGGVTKRFILLDVRHDTDYARGHLPGAVNLPAHVFADSLGSVLSRHWPDNDRTDLPVVVYCYGVSCIRSRNCTTLLAAAGYRDLAWFRTGYRGWRDIAGEVAAGESPR
jgi:rhodanese-related sulfurtransferase